MRRTKDFQSLLLSRIFHFNFRNMLSWYHNQTQESASHVQFHGRSRVMRCFRCGSNGAFCGGTIFVGLREDNVTLLSKVSCFSRTPKALKDSTYIVGAFEVSDKHSSVIGMNTQLFVQQELKVLSSFNVVHWYDIRMPTDIFSSACNVSKRCRVGTYVIRLAGVPTRGWDSGFVSMSCGTTHM